MQVQREIYEVLDESLLEKCSESYYNYDVYLVDVVDENKPKLDCEAVLKVKNDNVYEK
jgi:hypothetical protein